MVQGPALLTRQESEKREGMDPLLGGTGEGVRVPEHTRLCSGAQLRDKVDREWSRVEKEGND